MKRLLLAVLAAATLAAAMGYADQSSGKLIIPVSKTDPTSGKQMFVNYCAPCHGADARGHGPASAALRSTPTDLTALARSHNGRFPDSHIVSVLRFGSELPAHGSSQMPVWGPILGRMGQVNSQARELRMANLSRYLETLQVK